MNPSLGFVPVEEIRNVFTEALKQLEDEFKRLGVPSDPKTIIEFVDELRLRLNKRAQSNLERYMKSHPETKRKAAEAPNAAPQLGGWDEKVKAQKAKRIAEARAEALRDS